MRIERFAPSPTGLLHLGHAYSALKAFEAARAAKGRFLLRIEDIDTPRCRVEFEEAIYRDLSWLGLSWETPVLRQSDRQAAYEDALGALTRMGLTYRCVCTRKDILNAMSAPQEGVEQAPVYPGTCRNRPTDLDVAAAIRLDMNKAWHALKKTELSYTETGNGPYEECEITHELLMDTLGDVVLARRDIGTSYHLAVVVDDAHQEITHVTRGADMREATPIHVLLQHLLGLPTPKYHHHKLIRDEAGKRLAKRDDARSIAALRDAGMSAVELRSNLGF